MGWPEPVYAHVPLIHGPDGAKLSKRHGALGRRWPIATSSASCPRRCSTICSASAGAMATTRSSRREQAIEWFDLDGVGKSPSRFDLKKLENLNGHYIREADDGRLAGLVAPRVATLIGRDLSTDEIELLVRAMPELKPRAKNLNELAEGAAFLFQHAPARPRREGGRSLLAGDAPRLLARVGRALAALDEWTAPTPQRRRCAARSGERRASSSARWRSRFARR